MWVDQYVCGVWCIYMDGSKYMWGLVYMWMGLNMCGVWCICGWVSICMGSGVYIWVDLYVWGLVYVCGWVSVFMFGVSSESAMYLNDQLWQIISK